MKTKIKSVIFRPVVNSTFNSFIFICTKFTTYDTSHSNIILELLKRWQRQQNSEKLENHMESNFLTEKVLELDDKITNIDWGENRQFWLMKMPSMIRIEQLSYFYLSIISLVDNLRWKTGNNLLLTQIYRYLLIWNKW